MVSGTQKGQRTMWREVGSGGPGEGRRRDMKEQVRQVGRARQVYKGEQNKRKGQGEFSK